MIVVLTGSIGRFPIGGNAWVHMQYLLGLRDLGCDVYYLEDCGAESWVYNWETEQLTNDPQYPSRYVESCLEAIGWHGRWAYRIGDRSLGMEVEEIRELCFQADLLILLGTPMVSWRSEYCEPRRRIFIDLDPGFVQMAMANGDLALQETIGYCERLFTIGQRVGMADCMIPTLDRHWFKTLPPVSLTHWPIAENNDSGYFTTVMQWRSYQETIYQGSRYGNKDLEISNFIDLPQHTPQPLQMALTGGPAQELEQHGWKVAEGWIASRTPWSYREFIQQSRAEFSVAKHGYVQSRGGWFSDRSVCYLASGRPVVVQDTGLQDWLPVGKGILTYRNLQEAAAGIESINANYSLHRSAARTIAENYFSAMPILRALLESALD